MAISNVEKLRILTAAYGSGSFKCALLTSSYSQNIDTEQYWSGINSNEVSGTGYSANGVDMTGLAITQDSTDDEAVMDFDDPVFTSVDGFTARYAAFIKWISTAANSFVIGTYNFGADKVAGGGNFTLNLNSEGLINLN